jgi:coenzyme PQQ precursor peptide PqqA
LCGLGFAAGSRAPTGVAAHDTESRTDREEVTTVEDVAVRSRPPEWERPEFEEIECAPEVTMYVARLAE